MTRTGHRGAPVLRGVAGIACRPCPSSQPSASAGPVLPDGQPRDLYVVDGRITYEPQAGADTTAEGWIVPGLVDAHCHLGLDDFGATDDAETERRLARP